MAFCEGGLGKARKFITEIDDVLHEKMKALTAITGRIKAIEGDPTVQAIINAIPGGSIYEGYLDEAINVVMKGANTALSLADKLCEWLAGETEDGKDMKLVKLAQKATALADGKKHKQHFYDSAVQLDLEGLKPAV